MPLKSLTTINQKYTKRLGNYVVREEDFLIVKVHLIHMQYGLVSLKDGVIAKATLGPTLQTVPAGLKYIWLLPKIMTKKEVWNMISFHHWVWRKMIICFLNVKSLAMAIVSNWREQDIQLSLKIWNSIQWNKWEFTLAKMHYFSWYSFYIVWNISYIETDFCDISLYFSRLFCINASKRYV